MGARDWRGGKMTRYDWRDEYRPCPTCGVLTKEPHRIEWCRATLSGKPGPGAEKDEGAKREGGK